MKYTGQYVPPTLTVDAVLFHIVGGELQVVLIERPNEPFKGMWSLPGGYCAQGETTLSALNRIVHVKAGIRTDKDLDYLEQLYTFDTVARDPRGHAVTVSYMGCAQTITPQDSEAKTASFAVAKLPELAYDHATIIAYAHQRLIAKLSYTNAVYAFLPPKFTLSELQSTYEAILGKSLDKRNFRKKFLSLNLIHETNEMKREGAHRPAKLYRFRSVKLETLPRSFD